MARNADAAAIGDAFEPGRDIDPVAKNIGAIRDDVAEIDADPKFDAPFRRNLCISSDHAALNFDGTSDRVHDAPKLGEDAVASGVGDMAAVSGNFERAAAAAADAHIGSLRYAIQLASTVRLGKLNEARVAVARLIEAVPDFTVAGFTARLISSQPELVAAISSALTEAGLP